MKKANFNTLRDLPVPESWIENALAIPEAEEPKPAVIPFWRRPRAVAAAATLVLASALSLVLFLTMGNKTPVPVRSSSTEIVWTTDANGETVATENAAAAVFPDPSTSRGQQENRQPTQKKSGTAPSYERISGGSDSGLPAALPTDSGMTTAKTDPTLPDILPTEPLQPTAAERPTDHGSPADDPTEGQGDDPPTVLPVYPTESGWDPADPTQPVVPKPTQSPYKPSVSVSLSLINASLITDGEVYCKILDDNGVVLGDSDLFSDQHRAEAVVEATRCVLSYTPRDHGILPSDGTYSFEFYIKGRTLTKGKANLSAS